MLCRVHRIGWQRCVTERFCSAITDLRSTKLLHQDPPHQSPHAGQEALDLSPIGKSRLFRNLKRMRKAIEAGNLEGAIKLFSERALHGGDRLATDMCDMLLVICGRTGDIELAEMVLKRMEAIGMPRGYIAHSSMVCAYCRSDLIREAIEYLKTYVPREMATTVMYKVVLNACASRGEASLFDDCFRQLLSSGLKPNEKVWTQRIRMSGWKGKDAVKQAWRDIVATETPVGHKALAARVLAFQRCGAAEEAAAAVREMMLTAQESLAADGRGEARESLRKAFNAAISTAERHERPDLIKSLLLHLKSVDLRPDVYTYNALLRMTAKPGSSSKDSELLVSEMGEDSILPDDHSYAPLLRNYASEESCVEAERALQQMWESNVFPNTHCFNAVLDAYSAAGDLQKASEIYDSLFRIGEKPDQCTYLALFNTAASHAINVSQSTGQQAYEEEMTWSQAGRVRLQHLQGGYGVLRQWEKDMRRRMNLRHSHATMTALIRAYGRMRQVDDSLRVLEEQDRIGYVRPSSNAYTAAIVTAARCNRMRTALRLHRQMVKKGVPVTTAVFNALLVGLKHEAASKIVSREEVLRQMEAVGALPDAVTYHILVALSCGQGNVVEALRWVKQMRETSMQAAPETWATLVASCVTNGDSLTLKQTMTLMDARQRHLIESLLG